MPVPKQTPCPPAHVFLGNVAWQATERDVVSISVPPPRGRVPWGVAFVELARPDDAARVVAALDGMLLLDRPLRASLARS
jgi:hypothetical protein